MSNQEKSEHQRVLKDFEKQISTVTTLKEQKERLEEELRVSLLIEGGESVESAFAWHRVELYSIYMCT